MTEDGKANTSGEAVPTGNVQGMADASTALDYGDGTVIVTVVCEEQEYTAGVSDTAAVVNAVLTPAQLKKCSCWRKHRNPGRGEGYFRQCTKEG